MSALLGIVSFFTSPIGRWAGIGLLGVAIFFAGDIRGRRIEHAKCEAAAQAAKEAAVAQDRKAQQQLDTNNSSTMDELSKQKDAADARIRDLEKTLADGVIDCVYGADGKPATGGVQSRPGAGAGNAPAARPARVPTPRPRPAGDKG